MRIYDANKIRKFMEYLRNDSTIEELDIPPQSEYEVFRYRREEYCQDMPTGGFNHGFIYRNNRGRYTLVGEAVNDWKSYEN